jgi:hypothetical protein
MLPILDILSAVNNIITNPLWVTAIATIAVAGASIGAVVIAYKALRAQEGRKIDEERKKIENRILEFIPKIEGYKKDSEEIAGKQKSNEEKIKELGEIVKSLKKIKEDE